MSADEALRGRQIKHASHCDTPAAQPAPVSEAAPIAEFPTRAAVRAAVAEGLLGTVDRNEGDLLGLVRRGYLSTDEAMNRDD